MEHTKDVIESPGRWVLEGYAQPALVRTAAAKPVREHADRPCPRRHRTRLVVGSAIMVDATGACLITRAGGPVATATGDRPNVAGHAAAVPERHP